MFKRIYYGWWIVFACFFIGFYVSGITFYGFTALFEPFRKEFGWSYTQISLAASLRGMEMGIFAPLMGFLVDRWGSRKILMVGIATVGSGIIMLSFTRSLLMFYGAFLLIGFGAGGSTSVVTMSAVAHWFDKNVGKALGVMASGFGAGGLMVPVIVWLIEVFQWQGALIVLGVGGWVLGIPLSLVIRSKPEQDGDLSAGRQGGDSTGEDERRTKAVEVSFREVLKNRSFLLLNLIETIRMMAVSTVAIHVMPYLGSIGISRARAGLVAAAIPVISVVGRIFLGWLGDIFDKRYVMSLAFGFMCAGMVAFCFARVEWSLFLFLLFFPPSFGGMMVLRGATLREYFGRDSFGKMIGIVMGSASVGGIIGPTLAGWVFDTLGSYYFIWLALSGLAAVAVILALKLKR
jgi:MFS family permease